MKKTSVGVVIGRFQCPWLHEGHRALIDKAKEHSKLLICVTLSRVLGTPRDPLDYPTREQMVKEEYPTAIVMPLSDQPTDEDWTRRLNQLLKEAFPTDEITIYCGRPDGHSSVQSGYKGPHKIVEIDEVSPVSGTSLRELVGRSVDASRAFRHGVIYGATNQYARCEPVVDICLWRQTENGIQILLGKRDKEGGKVRLPGGHINTTDISAEAAARRELFEETGLTGEDFEIIDHIRVPALDLPHYAMFTTLFLAKYTFGAPQGKDDIDECFWASIDKLEQYQYADNHKDLTELAVKALNKRRNNV